MKSEKLMYTLAVSILIFSALFVNQGCQKVTAPTPVIEERIALYWENTSAPHPERKPWTDAMMSIIKADFVTYDSAKDLPDICPAYESLSVQDKLKALGEFFVAVSYFESSFNPASNSVDVGKPNDKGSWSVGLYQMSANDRSARKFGYSFEQLKDPISNIKVALEQFKTQIQNHGLYLMPNSSKGRYWAVILVGNVHSKIDDFKAWDKKKQAFVGPIQPGIKSRVLKYAPKCRG